MISSAFFQVRIKPLIAWVQLLLIVLALGWLVLRGTSGLGYHWQWYRVPPFIGFFESGRFQPGPLIQGLIVTLQVSGISLILAFILGLTTALLRLSNSYIGRALARVYLELVRNTPLLVQIFFMYFVIAPILGIGRFSSAVWALSLFEGAYASEIFRAGITSIPRGQWEGAYSLGMGPFSLYRYIILPQAVRRVLPPLTSQAIALVKDSALVSTIAIYDLTMRGSAIIAETYMTFEIWFTVAAIYLLVALIISLLVFMLERHLRVEPIHRL